MKVILVVVLMMITISLFSGCVDRTGYKECKNSYDNLHLKENYTIIGHTSDFLCCVEYRYMVSYHIKHHNDTFWLHGFIYASDDDELIWSGKLPEYVISIN